MSNELTLSSNDITEFLNEQKLKSKKSTTLRLSGWRLQGRMQIDFAHNLMNFMIMKNVLPANHPSPNDLKNFALTHAVVKQQAESINLLTDFNKEHQNIEGDHNNVNAVDAAYYFLGLNPDKASYVQILTVFTEIQDAYEKHEPFEFADGDRVPTLDDLDDAAVHRDIAIRHLIDTLEPGNSRLAGLQSIPDLEGEESDFDDEEADVNDDDEGQEYDSDLDLSEPGASTFRPTFKPSRETDNADQDENSITPEIRNEYMSAVFNDSTKSDLQPGLDTVVNDVTQLFSLK